MPIIATKLYIPPPRTNIVLRPHLTERLNAGLSRKLTLISAAAGFGKTTLVSEWVNQKDQGSRIKDELPRETIPPLQVAWLSLDEGDNDPARFLTYFVAALQTIAPNLGAGVLGVLQVPQPPPIEAILTALVNEISSIPNPFVLVLDDYHVMDAKPIDDALTFLLEHLPPQMHLVIATREDPQLPVARLRARDQLTELRASDLRFTLTEAAEFLNRVMGLQLSAQDIAALETRTEGWIAGLQLASLSMQGQQDPTAFIKAFTGTHHFVLDYLMQEVLQQQSESIQDFLLRTSILERLCGPLCDAVLDTPAGSGQETLAALEQANLFIVPLDNERRWYRYHHLFADLLRQRLQQRVASSVGDAGGGVSEYHQRASQWYEAHDLDLEAFQHAVAANDIARAERLIGGTGIPLHFRGAVTTILRWLESLPTAVLNDRPWLWWRYASLLLVNGQTTGVDEKLDAVEDALQATAPDDKTRNLIGQIAVARATLGLTRYQVDTILAQSHRALEYLDPNNPSYRAAAYWSLAFACYLQGDRVAAEHAYTESIALSKQAGDIFTTILATIGLGSVQELDNHLPLAAQTYRQVLQLAGDQPLQIIGAAQLGLARVLYEWNDLDGAEQHGRQSLHLARQYDSVIDRFIICEVFLARLKLARGDVAGASAMLAQAEQTARRQNFVFRIPEIAAAQVLVLLCQGNFTASAQLADSYKLSMSRARVYLAQREPSAALAVLGPLRAQMEQKGWADERLKIMILQALALHAQGDQSKAVQLLGEALTLAEPDGFIRSFVDEGLPMAQLLKRMKDEGGRMKEYLDTLLVAFGTQSEVHTTPSESALNAQSLIEPLSQRELEILHLIAQGLSNGEISKRLFLALSTIKGHNRKIFDKLQVTRRTEALARARALGLL